MSETVQVVFGICGLAGGSAGLVAAFIVWRTQRAELDYLKRRLGLPS